MNRQDKFYAYYARWGDGQSEGVIQKITNTVAALRREGVVANTVVVRERGFHGEIQYLRALIESRVDVMIVRYRPFFGAFYLPFLIYKRIAGVKVVLDVPTPICAVVNEVRGAGGAGWYTRLKILWLYLMNPLGLLPASRILQYAPDSRYFSGGVSRVTMQISNGINVSAVPLRRELPCLDGTLVFVGVAQLADWHGYDRLIRSIYEFNSINTARKCKFLVVGEGEAKNKLVALHADLGGDDAVEFLGFQSGDSLTEIFESAHIGVCSLGLFRIGLHCAAILKAREYVARGLPIVLSGDDLDFDGSLFFVERVVNSDADIDLSRIYDWYQELVGVRGDFRKEVRQYALDKLDFDKKVRAAFMWE